MADPSGLPRRPYCSSFAPAPQGSRPPLPRNFPVPSATTLVSLKYVPVFPGMYVRRCGLDWEQGVTLLRGYFVCLLNIGLSPSLSNSRYLNYKLQLRNCFHHWTFYEFFGTGSGYNSIKLQGSDFLSIPPLTLYFLIFILVILQEIQPISSYLQPAVLSHSFQKWLIKVRGNNGRIQNSQMHILRNIFRI